jgi:hypothetical protein
LTIFCHKLRVAKPFLRTSVLPAVVVTNSKAASTTRAPDPLTGEVVVLFHPRQQQWAGHFQWDETGIQLIGLTAIGRATIVALNMNNSVIVDARRRWVSVGWHPPIDLR